MRYGIISDIHSNLEALEAVLNACREDGARSILCLGDIVGYGANPKECIRIVQNLNAPCIAGNHDWAVTGQLDTSDFNDAAKEAVHWTRGKLDSQEMEYLKRLDLVYKNDDFILVHGSLHRPEEFIYLIDSTQAPDTFYLMDRKVCFIGHTHVPLTFIELGNTVQFNQSARIEFKEDQKYIVNVGSVGQPRDGNPLASYGIYDPDLRRVEIKRVSYDIEAAQGKIFEARLPEMLARRLMVGQ